MKKNYTEPTVQLERFQTEDILFLNESSTFFEQIAWSTEERDLT